MTNDEMDSKGSFLGPKLSKGPNGHGVGNCSSEQK